MVRIAWVPLWRFQENTIIIIHMHCAVIAGVHRGKNGKVLHVFRSFVFIHQPTVCFDKRWIYKHSNAMPYRLLTTMVCSWVVRAIFLQSERKKDQQFHINTMHFLYHNRRKSTGATEHVAAADALTNSLTKQSVSPLDLIKVGFRVEISTISFKNSSFTGIKILNFMYHFPSSSYRRLHGDCEGSDRYNGACWIAHKLQNDHHRYNQTLDQPCDWHRAQRVRLSDPSLQRYGVSG